MSRRTISLSRELWLLVHAVQAVRRAAEAFDHGAEVPAMLTLIEGRLVMLERSISDEIDPALIWCPSNNAGVDIGGDLCIREWSAGRTIKKARIELHRAKRRRQQKQRRAAS